MGAEVSHKQATNYQNKSDGRVYGTAFNETDLSGYVGLNKKWAIPILTFLYLMIYRRSLMAAAILLQGIH